MSKTNNFIKLHRKIKTNPIWLEKPYSKGQAWVDLLLYAQWKQDKKKYRGKTIELEPGKVYTSIYALSDRWGWSRNRVYRFLEELIIAKMISVEGWENSGTSNGTTNGTINRTKNGTTDGTTITVENWDVYQYVESTDGTTNGTTDGTTDDSKTEPTEEIKNIKNEKKENNIRSLRSDSPSETPDRGTDAFRNKSHLLLKADEGTKDDIPKRYRKQFKTFAEYWGYRNQ